MRLLQQEILHLNEVAMGCDALEGLHVSWVFVMSYMLLQQVGCLLRSNIRTSP